MGIPNLTCAALLLPLSQLPLAACLPYATRTYEHESGKGVSHLVFGREVRVDFYDRRGIQTSRLMASYDEPMPCMAITECAAIIQAELHDDDSDGRWDRWQRRTRHGERCFVEYRVDTDGDGAWDWVFLARRDDHEETMGAIRLRRGY